jgi:hypothetical protein
VDFGDLYDLAWGVIGVVGGIGAIVALLWASARSTRERDDEVHAREFYAEHGHWPDEGPRRADALPPVG